MLEHDRPICSHAARRASLGMTLVELLVVVFIIVLLLAAAVPLMRPALQDAQLREGIRQLNVLCAVAQARARELGRPAGIWIERSEAGSNAVFEVHLAETPSPYSGDFGSAVAYLVDTDTTSPDGIANEIRIPQAQSASFWNRVNPSLSLVQGGDLIQFNLKGPKYQIVGNPWFRAGGGAGTIGPYYVVSLSAPDGKSLPTSTWAGSTSTHTPTTATGVPYTVYRQPVKSSLNSVQFGGGTVVDLEYSGIGVGSSSTLFDAGNTNAPNNLTDHPVVVMFEPGGSVTQVYTRYLVVNNATIPPTVTRVFGGQPVNGTIYLLVGKFEQARPAPNPTTAVNASRVTERGNLEDMSALWLAIGASTGTVTTAENAGGTSVAEARLIARTAEAMGGN